MGISSIFAQRGTSAPSTPLGPARQKLDEHLAKVRTNAEANARWAQLESEENARITAATHAEQALAALEQRRIDLLADREVLGRSDVDPDSLSGEIVTSRERLVVLKDRAKLATSKLARIRDQRDQLREEGSALLGQLRELRYDALREMLGAAMPALVEAEGAYVAALQEAFGIAEAINTLCRLPGVTLPFGGSMTLSEFWVQRPYHEAFKETPFPDRGEMAKAIQRRMEEVLAEV